jgi:DNA repair protein RadC
MLKYLVINALIPKFVYCLTNPLQSEQVKNRFFMSPKTQISLFGQVSELKLSYNPKTRPSERPVINASGKAWEILFKDWEDIAYYESFKVIALNRANKVLGVALISRGGLTGTVVDPKIILQYALMSNASGLILAHNHPSGNLCPSQADVNLTQKIKTACLSLDVNLLDHIILSPENAFYSFADEGKI